MATTLPPVQEQPAQPTGIQLTALAFPDGYVPGKYASFPVSPEDMFGPDELGQYKSAIDDLDEIVTRADSSARLWEVLQAWEARLFSRGYQFLNAGKRGWGMYGAVNGASASGAEIMQSMNQGKMFAVNVYAAREDKIVAALSRDVPGLTFVPKRDADSMDQTAADEAKKYLKVWLNDAGIKELVGKIAQYFYTDDRVILYTRSVADEQAWGTETPAEQQEAFGASAPEGVTPETEMQGAAPAGLEGGADNAGTGAPLETAGVAEDVPAVRELTTAYGKLEAKVPIYADSQGQMPWIRISSEENQNTLKERYEWIADKINAGASEGKDQLDRMARINVRLAVQVSASSGESLQQDATETYTWYRPSQYRAIKDKDVQKLFKTQFPAGLLVVRAGGQFAFCRNEAMGKHLAVLHPKHGSGQNRRAIGSNYLPLQKILNAGWNLLDRYFRNAIARRFHDAEAINSEAINGQANDPAKSTPVLRKNGEAISNYTGLESVPQPTPGLFEWIQWLIEGGPEAMDGASPAMFGMEDADTFGATKLNRDQALQVFSMPWSQICIGLAKAAEQAVECAAMNRVADISSNVPGQGKLTIELGKLQGNALCYPESMEIPQTIAELEAQAFEAMQFADKIQVLQAMLSDPRNLTLIAKFPTFEGWEIPGLDDVEQQQGEFELLLQSGPLDNPQVQQIQEHIQKAEMDPEAATPEGQDALKQLQDALQGLPPQISSVPVAQDGSENHAIHATITLGWLNSAEGRKFKNGTEEMQAVYQNFKLHWSQHVEMGQKLTPPKEMEFKGTLSVDPSKYSPEVQAKVFQAAGLQVSPEEATGNQDLVPHEVTTEQEGVNEHGVPTKKTISMVGKGLR